MFGKKSQIQKPVEQTAVALKAKNRRKFYLFAGISLANILGISAASIAWFDVVSKSASIDAVSGDLNVSIEKVTVHKNVYPFYENSTEFINYESPGEIKSYVAQDAGGVNFTLNSNVGTCHTGETVGSVSDIQYQTDDASLYYLVGNASFSGEGSLWSTSSGRAFTSRDEVSENVGATLKGTVLNAGDEFILFNLESINNTAFTRYSYQTAQINRAFEYTYDEGETNPRLKCLKSGTYDFVFYPITDGNSTSYRLSITPSNVNVRPNYSSSTTITMTTASAPCHSAGDSGTKTNIHYEDDRSFRYYLVGDTIFTGVAANPWSTLSGSAFGFQESVSTTKSAILTNVTVSIGAEFTLFDTSTISNGNSYSKFQYTVNSSNPRFEVTPEGNLRCLKNGIYTFTYNLVGSTPTLTIAPSRIDDAFIGNGTLDPTMIIIDFAGGNTGKATIQEYLPEAIRTQKTMVVLDVELKFNNANMVDVGLEIRRTSTSASPSVYSLSGTSGHENDPYTNLDDFTNSVNTMNASDFYRYYALIQQNELADPWNYFYNNYWDSSNPNYAGSNFEKFSNDKGESYETVLPCDLDHNDNESDVFVIPPSVNIEAGTTYHCYVGIDYDDVYTNFFLAPDRLGKTYHLQRDFFLYFTGTQHIANGGGQ